MYRICRRKSDNRIIESQLGGSINRLSFDVFNNEDEYLEYLKQCEELENIRLNTLKQNALNAGYKEDEIEVFWAMDEDYIRAIEIDPVRNEEKQKLEAKELQKQEELNKLKELKNKSINDVTIEDIIKRLEAIEKILGV